MIVSNWKEGWTKSIGLFLTGKLDEKALLTAAEKPGDESVNSQQCEALYYIGMMRLLKGDQVSARDFLQKCIATGEKNEDEYDFARAELARLDAAEKK
jgi:lipoprotein NlpI